eukprot:15458407-Alexandrium_andersonii.AAC.1
MVLSAKLCVQKGQEYGVPVAMLKADIKKAFDSLSHKSLACALLQRGVPGVVVSALLVEMRECRLSFSVPGQSSQVSGVQMSRGVRQGASSSPMIWAITLDE